MYCHTPRTRGWPKRPKGQLGQRRGQPLAYLLDLAEDGVCGLDLPFAQLPQGHLLEVNLWRREPPEGPLCRVKTKSWTKNSSGLLGPRRKQPLLGRLVFLGRPRDPPLQTLQSHASARSVQSLREKSLAHFAYRRASRPGLSHSCAHCEMHHSAQARAIFKKDVTRHGSLTPLGPERPASMSSTRRRGDEEATSGW